MFTAATFRNFKSLSNLTIKRLSPITLIGGKNNVGKTSILEALFLFFDRLNPEMLVRQLGWRGMDMLPVLSDYVWAPFFHQLELSRPVHITVNDESGAKYELNMSIDSDFVLPNIRTQEPLRNAIVSPSKSDSSFSATAALHLVFKKNEKIIQDSHLVLGPGPQMGMHVKTGSRQDLDAVFMGARAAIPHHDEAQRFGRLDMARKVRGLVDTLQKIEPRLRSLSTIVVAGQPVVHAEMEGIPNKIPLGYVGHGFTRLMSIALAIHASPGGAVFIDEIENGLHHSLLPQIWEIVFQAAKDNNCQVIATTHSYECLKAAADTFENKPDAEFSYIRIDRTNKGAEATPYTLSEINLAMDSRWEIR